MELTNFIPKLNWTLEMLIALLATFILYFAFKKTAELGKHAAQNTSATLVVAFANIILLMVFVEDLNAFAQKSYGLLGIPTINANTWDNFPIWIVALIGIAVKDFADYWNHRLMHTKWGWPTHAAHHSDTHVNAFSVYRVHILEVLLMSLSYIVLLTWLQMPHVLPIVVIFHSLHGMYVHMNLNFNHGPLRYLIASPAYHRWHHADAPQAYGKNLANVMPIYDVMFGTYYFPDLCDEPMGALSDGIEDKNPLMIYIYPFQKWARMIKGDWANLGKARRAKDVKAGPKPAA